MSGPMAEKRTDAATRGTSAAPARVARIAPRIWAGAGFALVIAVVSAVAAWPIYRSGSFVLLVGAGGLVGAAIAATKRRGIRAAFSREVCR